MALAQAGLAMRIVLIFSLLVSAVSASAQVGFEEKYRRDYNVFHEMKQYRPVTPPSPPDVLDPTNPANLITPLDPADPSNSTNSYTPDPDLRLHNPLNPKAPVLRLQTPTEPVR